ncbi:MAG: hypothetical protein KDA96_13830 [Planctomycetaceae bacterium]|nr:hypothetical protein [Planctomycetaceae bacterium]
MVDWKMQGRMIRQYWVVPMWTTALAAVLSSGCSEQGEIQRYEVPKMSQEVMLEATPNTTVGPKVGQPTRMLAAILPRGRQTWFFKLLGPDEAVAEQKERFEAFVASIQFSDGSDDPEFDLPEGWQRLPGGGMRFATLRMGAVEAPMDLTVIPLPTGQGDLEEYILANINRWREQLELPTTEVLTLPDATGSVWRIVMDDKTAVTAVNLVGSFQGADMAMAPSRGMALPGDHPPIGSSPLADLPSAGAPGFTWQTPEGWVAGNAGGMRKLAFTVSQGDARIEITVISLPASGGDRPGNINRWREQVGLGPLDESELADSMESVDVDGHPGQYVNIPGSESQDPREAVLGVLVDVEQETWFFKLKGEAELAQREEQKFRDFVSSIRFGVPDQGSQDAE